MLLQEKQAALERTGGTCLAESTSKVPPDDPTASPSADDQSDDIIDAEPAADVYLAKFQVSLGEPLGLDFDICDPGMLLVSNLADIRQDLARFGASILRFGS